MSTPTKPTLQDRTPKLADFGELIEPATPQEVAEVLESSASSGQVVVPVGGAGALSLGNPTCATAVGVSTKRLNQLIDYQSTDMTLAVQAGVTLAEISAALAEHGQMLPIEAPHPEQATIGGLLATALTGPRRYGGGSLRDVIIGITVAYPDGTVGKAGGLVVKNVSGFDMMRVHYGALGTLGVITSANFKILPLPRAEFSVLHPLANLDDSAAILPRLRPLSVRPTALTLRQVGHGWLLAARFEGRESGLKAVSTALADVLTMQDRLDADDSAVWWRQLIDGRALTDPPEVRIQVSCRPTEIVSTSKSVLDVLQLSEIEMTSTELEPGLGVATFSWQDQPQSSAELIRAIRIAVPDATVIVLCAPDNLKSTIDVWGEPPQAIELMRRLKHEFDPNRVLNPGRFAGMI